MVKPRVEYSLISITNQSNVYYALFLRFVMAQNSQN